MNCDKCSIKITEHDQHEHAGLTLCEDCYIDAVSAPKTCDPWAVYSATRTTSKEETLTAEQKIILDAIKTSGPLTLTKICEQIEMSEEEFRSNFATLRHMELAQACQRDGQIYYILFEKKPA